MSISIKVSQKNITYGTVMIYVFVIIDVSVW